jgi:hypothetical protein
MISIGGKCATAGFHIDFHRGMYYNLRGDGTFRYKGGK